MLPRDVLRQIRRLHIRARRAVDSILGGEYRSVFKGAGIAFEEVREYQPGDDVRAIDWNVTARMGHPFIKRYVEERELTVILLVDWSASNRFGTGRQLKRDVLGELAAILAFSAVANNDKVGLVGLSDRVERFLPPRRGVRHALRLIRDVLFFQPKHTGTSLTAGMTFLNRILHRRSIVFLLTDFLDHGFDQALKRTGRSHDLIAVQIVDPREEELPQAGFVELEDLEAGRRTLLDSSNAAVRRAFASRSQSRREGLRRLARSAGIDLVEVSTDGNHLDALVRFFQLRERRQKNK